MLTLSFISWLVSLQQVMSKNPKNWWKLTNWRKQLILAEKVFIFSERFEEFQWRFQEICNLSWQRRKLKVTKNSGFHPLFWKYIFGKIKNWPHSSLLEVKKCWTLLIKKNWKHSFQLIHHTFHKYHSSFDLVAGLKLQYHWKSISLLRGFSIKIFGVIFGEVRF